MRCSFGVLTTMKNLIAAVVVGWLTASLVSNPVAAEEINAAPDWQRVTTTGDTFHISEAVKERPVVLFFWASWCPYCKALMPHLQSIRLEYGDDIEIVAVQLKDKADAGDFMRKAGYDFTVIGQAGKIADLYDVFTTPGLIIVDEDQEILFDLRNLERLPEADSRKGHAARAAILAPYWAANLRQHIDIALR